MKTVGKHLLKVLLAVTLSAMVVSYCSERITEINSSITRLRQVASAAEKASESAATLRVQLKQWETANSALESALIQAENSLEFLAYLEGAAAQSTMAQKVRFTSPKPHAGTAIPVSALDYTVELGGTHATLAKYLSLLETARYYTAISSISLNSTTEKGWNGLSNIVLSGTLYVKP